LPKDKLAKPFHEYIDMSSSTSLYNYTAIDAARLDTFAGTLSPATLQCILEYTTQPRDIVLSFNAQFGSIFNAAENCGRFVFGTERPLEYFANQAAGVAAGLRAMTKVKLESEEEITPKPTGKGNPHVPFS
jgi:hypothetical protein